MYFWVVWTRLNIDKSWKLRKVFANLGRMENAQEKCRRFVLRWRLKIRRELCGVGLWENSRTSS